MNNEIPNPTPPTIAVVEAAVIERRDRLVARLTKAHSVYTGDAAREMSPSAANQVGELFSEARSIEREVEAGRKAAKAPFLDVSRAIDDAAKAVCVPLAEARALVAPILNDYERKVREEQARAEAERRKAEAERVAAIRAEEERQRIIAENKAKAAAAAAEPDAEPVELAPVPEAVEIPTVVAAPVTVPAGPKKTRTHTTYSVTIVDVSLIPREFMAVDERAVLAALKAGVAVPGATLVTTETVVATGR